MKRLLIISIVLAAVAMTSLPVLAGTARVSSRMCWSFEYDGVTRNLILHAKKQGNVRTGDGTIQFYEIRGILNYYGIGENYYSIFGAGSFTTHPRSSNPIFSMQLVTNEITGAQGMEVSYTPNDGIANLYVIYPTGIRLHELSEVNCRTIDTVYGDD